MSHHEQDHNHSHEHNHGHAHSHTHEHKHADGSSHTHEHKHADGSSHTHEHEHADGSIHTHGHTHEHSHHGGHNSHGHTHIDQDHDTGIHHSEKTELSLEEKMLMLLKHWVDHNNSHKDSYASWAKKLENENINDAAAFLIKAEDASQQITKSLQAALELLENRASG